MKTRLASRGKLVIAIVVLGFALGWAFGGRSLNVVVVPGIVLVAATGLYVLRFENPEVIRHAPSQGHQGETRRVDLWIESQQGYPATVKDRSSPGISGFEPQTIVTDGRWISQEITLEKRGRQTIGPTRITAQDPFGLWEREFTYPKTASVMIFPKVSELADGRNLLREFIGLTDEREHFDSVREYVQGDPLRDINWKTSAKHQGELYVTEYAGEGVVDRVTIAAESVGPATDEVAEAAASLSAYLLDAGLSVGLVTRDGQVDPGTSDAHHRRLLELLAMLERGPIEPTTRGKADILVRSPRNSETVEIQVDGDQIAYGDLRTRGQQAVVSP